MSGVLDGIASTLAYYTGYDLTGSATPPPPASSSSPLPALPQRPSTAGTAGTADYSSISADPSTLPDDADDENITSLHASSPASNDEYFNLGGSSFPLLPHAPHMGMQDPYSSDSSGSDDDSQLGPSGEHKQQLVASSRSSHHFSSVLNNPLSTYDDFEEEDMLPFAPQYISALSEYHIDVQQVTQYIRGIGSVDAYRDNHPGALLAIPSLTDGPVAGPPSYAPSPSMLSPFAALPQPFTFHRRRSSGRTVSSSSAAGATSLSRSRSHAHKRGTSAVSAQAALAKAKLEEEQQAQRELAECLSTVPAPFFSASFDLLQQPFFLEHLSSILLPASSSVSQKHHTANSLSLQSTLSSHLDMVEVSLFRAINARSHQFFDVMARVEALKAEISDCLDGIQSVHAALSYVDTNLVSGGLQVVSQHVRRSNVTALCTRLELMQMCSRTQQTVQLLLGTGDYGSSLMLIQQTRAVLSAELSGVAAMRNVERKLLEQVRMIEKLMESDMMSIILQQADWGAAATLDDKERRRADVVPIRRELTEDEKERLVPIFENLVKLGAIAAAIAAYKRELAACIKQRIADLVYQHIDTVVNDDLEDSSQQQPPPAVPGVAATATSPSNAGSSTAAVSTSSPSSAPSITASSSPSTASPAAAGAAAAVAAPETVPAVVDTAAPSTSTVTVSPQSSSPTVEPPAAATEPPPPAASSPEQSSSSPSPAPDRISAPIAAPVTLPSSQPASSAPPSTAAASSTITTRLQALSHRQFVEFLSPLFSSLMDSIYRASAVKALLASTLSALDRELDVTASLTPASSPGNVRLLASLSQRKAEYASSLQLMAELLSSSSELLHLRIAKLLHTRQHIHAHLPLPSFRELLDLVLSFLHQSEAMCGRQFYGLRGALLGQAKAFVGVFHAECMREMAETLEKERWVRVDVDYEYQELIDNGFVRRKDAATAAATGRTRKSDGLYGEEENKLASSKAAATGDEEKKEDRNGTDVAAQLKTERKVLFVPIPRSSSSSAASPSSSSPGSSSPSGSAASSSGSNFVKFPVVRSVLTLLTLISHYVDLSSHLPALTLDTLNRLLDLLTLFNSRTCQLVLGAGAMHLAGLRSITATHLALSSQAIALLSTQVDGLKRLFASRLTPKQHVFLVAFDRVRRDCDEHVGQVREKLVMIMRDLIDGMMKKMQLHLLAAIKPRPAGTAAGPEDDEDEEDDVVSPAIRTLMKQTCSLHRALTDLLSGRERNLIFQQIGGSLVGGFIVACRKVEAEAAAAGGAGGRADRVRVSLQGNGVHILMRMRTLTGVEEDVMLQLKELVEQQLRVDTPASATP